MKPFPKSLPSDHVRLHNIPHKTNKPKRYKNKTRSFERKRKDRRENERGEERKGERKKPYKRRFETKNKNQELVFGPKKKKNKHPHTKTYQNKKFKAKRTRKGSTIGNKTLTAKKKKTGLLKTLKSFFKRP